MAAAMAMAIAGMVQEDSEGQHREKHTLEGGIKDPIKDTAVLGSMEAGVQGDGMTSMAGDLWVRTGPWTTVLAMGTSGNTLFRLGTQQQTHEVRNSRCQGMA
jgi:hypothetical protein